MKAIATCGHSYIFLVYLSHISAICHQVSNIRTLNVYLYVFGAETLEIIFISEYQAQGLLFKMLSMNSLTHILILCI